MAVTGSPISENRFKVSVVVPSYNHQKFLPGALNSVLCQEIKDYELLLIDDASSDQSAEIIREFLAAHAEIPSRFSRHEKNQGGVITLNQLIEQASGEYVALINSDDIWLPEKLHKQLEYLDAHPETGAVFTQARIIDDDNRVVNTALDFKSDIFIQTNRSRGQWLRRLFFELNCLCHPSILIRRSVYDEIGLYDPRFRQLPDMQMWVRLLKHSAIHMIEEPLVQLRIHARNTSKVTAEAGRRNLNELSFILADFFTDMPLDVLVDGFGEFFKDTHACEPLAIECEKAFLYFSPHFAIRSIYTHIGLKRLYDLLANPETRQVLIQRYNLDYEQFFKLGGQEFFDNNLIAFSNTAEPFSQSLFSLIKLRLGTYLLRYPGLFKFVMTVWGWRRGFTR